MTRTLSEHFYCMEKKKAQPFFFQGQPVKRNDADVAVANSVEFIRLHYNLLWHMKKANLWLGDACLQQAGISLICAQ